MAGFIPREFITELLQRIDVVDVVQARVPLKKRGNNFTACCPFHQEKSPSFSVSQSKQFYHCFGCGAHGNAIGFLMAYDGLEFIESVEQLCQSYNIDIPYEKGHQDPQKQQQQTDIFQCLEQCSAFYQQQLRHSNGQIAVNYLKQRGLTGDIAKQYAIGYAPEGWHNLNNVLAKLVTNHQQLLLQAGMLIAKEQGNDYDRFRNRIMFPIRNVRGQVIGFGGRVLDDSTPKYLNSPETPVFHKGYELYGLYEARLADKQLNNILVVEGYMDVIALSQHGIHNAVATLGTAATEHHVKKLFRYSDEIIFCFDGDRAGRQAAERALHTLLPVLNDRKRVKFMFLPEKDDPDSLVRRLGREQFLTAVNQATHISDYFFQSLIGPNSDVTSVEGKAHIAKNAQSLLHDMPESYFKNLLIERLSQILRLERQALLQLLHGGKPPTAAPTNKTQGLTRTPVTLAIAMLLQVPQLLKHINDKPHIFALEKPGIALLQQLVNMLQEYPNSTTATLLEYWRDNQDFHIIDQLTQMDLLIDEDLIADEFIAIVKQLEKLANQELITHLLNKVQNQSISDAEKSQLQDLLQHKDGV